MRGMSEDLCHNIGMFENMGQIQWEYLKFVGLSFGLLHVCGEDIHHNSGMLENISQIQWEYFCLSGSLLAYFKYAGEEGRSMPQHMNASEYRSDTVGVF